MFDGEEAEPFADQPYTLDCPLYCSVIMRKCQASFGQFASLDGCAHACAAYPADAPEDAVQGDSLQCRFNVLVVARPPTLRALCRAAGPTGGALCQ